MASVFPAPQRQLLACADYSAVAALSRERFGRGVSRQAFGIFGKVGEVDQVMTPALQRRIIEVHPEVSLWVMNGRHAMVHSKKRPAGFDERRELLTRCLHADVPETRSAARLLAPFAAADDLLDAMAVAWTARRAATQAASRVPSQPELDARGLRMEIVY
jgi:predicted RNase H-like nuclease